MEEKSLAMEMLEELKRSNERLERQSKDNAKKWFIISIVELLIIVSMIIGFLIYESQYEVGYVDETTQTIEDIDNNSTATQNIN